MENQTARDLPIEDVIDLDRDDLPSAVVPGQTCKMSSLANFWSVHPTGDMTRDGDMGQTLAIEAILDARRRNSHMCLAFMLAEIVERGQLRAIEAGFLSQIASGYLEPGHSSSEGLH